MQCYTRRYITTGQNTQCKDHNEFSETLCHIYVSGYFSYKSDLK